MKQILIFLLITAFVSCQKKDSVLATPTSGDLYKTWKLTKVLQNGQPVNSLPGNFTVTFPRNGNFRGDLPVNSADWCCSPVAFERTNATIRFIYDGSAPVCASINCLQSPFAGSVTWQITTLSDTTLVLTGGSTVLEFDAQP